MNMLELDMLVKKLEEKPEEHIILDADLLRQTRGEMESQIKREEEEKERIRKNHVDVREFQTPEEAVAYAKLVKAGFAEPQIKCVLRLLQGKKKGISVEEILGTFDPEMDMETVEIMVDLMVS